VEWTWVVTTTIPVVTFIGGLWWNRVDGDRRERRARRVAFEQFQRATHLELQDHLGKLYLCLKRIRDAREGDKDLIETADEGRARSAELNAATRELDAEVLLAGALVARLYNQTAAQLANDAIHATQDLARAIVRTPNDPPSSPETVQTAMATVIDYLGRLTSEPPTA
jgi:hypothetical protein